jgi:hypothetical protein
MNAKLSILAVLAFAGLSMAASVVAVSSDTSEVTQKPAYWFSFKDTGNKATYASTNKKLNGQSKDINLTVASKGVAGVGFTWKQNCDEDGECSDATISLKAYKGVCLTYSATAPFRLDMRQFTITDDNYFGKTMPASETLVSTFIDFGDLSQGWESDKPATWNAGVQTGMQFIYKEQWIKKNGNDNAIRIEKIVLGDNCPTFAPTLKKSATSESIDLPEGEPLTVSLSTIFEDKDGGSSVTVKISNDNVVQVTEGKTFSLTDKLVFSAKPNTDGTANIVLTATDSINDESVSYTYKVTVEDVENPPVAVKDSFEMLEDEVLEVPVKKSVLANDYDVDEGDDFSPKMTLVDSTEHGELSWDEDGLFTYTPEQDFYGTETWTYQIVDATGLKATGTVVITVKNVNDPLKLEVVPDDIFTDVVKADEDFEEPIEIDIKKELLTFTDADGVGNLKYGVKTSGVVNASFESIASYYVLTLTSVLNKNGLDSVFFYATEGGDTAGVFIHVDIAPVADDPLAVADSFDVFEDSTVTIKADKGVLVNDVNPDDPSVGLVAVLDTTTAKGELKLNEDGSFTYTPSEDFVGKDYFVYHVYADDEGKRESAKVKVTLNVKDMNDGPIVKVDVKTLDTTMTEDQSRVVQYAKQVVASWFEDPEKDPLTFSASSDDDKTIVNITAAGILQIKVAPDSSGDAYVTVAATDSVSGGSAELKIHVTIKPAPDKPVIAKKDSLCVKDTTKWSIKIALTDYFTDADGDSLTYTPAIPKDMADAIEVEVKGDTLIVSAKEKAVFMKGDLVAFSVKATDPTAASVTGSFYVFVGLEKPPVSIRAIAAAPKATWQNAVKASRGAVALLDMQGRVMWKAPLPVSEMDVRNAAAQVQGRKILRVNSQTWTIK